METREAMEKTHTDSAYERELHDLRETLLRMAGLCEEMIADAIRSIVERNSELARATIEKDFEVNRAEVQVDELVFLILAKRQPVAKDLRFTTQAIKMANELERIGDLAVNICERALLLNVEPQLKPYQDIPKMADIVMSMVRESIDAFVKEDADLAEQIMERDDEVDDLYHVIIRDLLAIMLRNPDAVERGIHIQSIAKFLERMADHSTNLCEQVVFLVKGKDVRQIDGLEKVRKG